MTTITITLNDASELAEQNSLGPPAMRALSLRVRVINLGDARHTVNVLSQLDETRQNLYGFCPIPSGGSAVTNEMVNELREELGI